MIFLVGYTITTSLHSRVKIRRLMFPNYIKFVDRRILRHPNCGRVGRAFTCICPLLTFFQTLHSLQSSLLSVVIVFRFNLNRWLHLPRPPHRPDRDLLGGLRPRLRDPRGQPALRRGRTLLCRAQGRTGVRGSRRGGQERAEPEQLLHLRP